VLGRFSRFEDFEPSGLLGLGDAVCLTEVSASIRSRYGCDIAVRYADRLDGDEFSRDLILVGGPDANSLTRDILRRLSLGLTLGDPTEHEVSFYSTVTRTLFAPERNAAGQIAVDFGVILRVPNPFAPGRRVLMLFGCFGFGTWAAGRCAGSESFLAEPLVAAGADLECVVRTDVIRDVPQPAVVSELRTIPSLLP
jgi:hypothetical protein